jgi:hydroxyacylglutathione hydrolase
MRDRSEKFVFAAFFIILVIYVSLSSMFADKDSGGAMGIAIKRLAVGALEENCYIVYDESTKEAMVIDPGDESERILTIIKDEDLDVKYLVCTHTHFDHVGALPELKEKTGATIIMHRDDEQVYAAAKDMAAVWGFKVNDMPAPDELIEEGYSIYLGDAKFEVIHTPGHSPGSICLYGEGLLFSGDTVFAGSIGRTDFPGGSIEKMKDSFRRVISFPDDTQILSGHGPATTVEREKRENFFVHEL